MSPAPWLTVKDALKAISDVTHPEGVQ
jgi:hypothetical protein